MSATSLLTKFVLTAPGTDDRLRRDAEQLVAAGQVFEQLSNGIWDLTRPERRHELDRFATEYAAVRAAEQRKLQPAEVRALPNIRSEHPLADMWSQRAESFAGFKRAITNIKPACAVDIGAGCGWLSAHLAAADWNTAAVDITVDGGDGLGAALHHHADLLLLRAEMEALPFATGTVDLAVFNASLHYASDIVWALTEATRVLRPGATLLVFDSPVFTDPDAGRSMVAEFDEHIGRTYGLRAATLAGPGFVTEADISPFDFARIDTVAGLRGRLHRWRGARRAGRETASRPLLIASKRGAP